jgi:DNA-binding PadR family transcriptional regulator
VRTEDLRKNILKMLKGEEFYEYEIREKLAPEGVTVEISQLYRVLNKMLRERLIESRWEKNKSGTEKRVYRLSGKGRQELDRIFLDAIDTINTFYSEYLLSLPSKVSAFDNICKLLAEELREQSIIVYIAPEPPEHSAMHERMICCLHSRVPQGKIYLVKPRLVELHLRLDNLLFLDGSYEKVPLKDGYSDLIVVTSMPKNHLLRTAFREWRRVLKESGKLAILTSRIFLREYKDPLTISDFIEKHEREVRRQHERVDKKAFRESLKESFSKVEEKQIAHMTVFLASQPHFLR